jgi:hypothetical protein
MKILPHVSEQTMGLFIAAEMYVFIAQLLKKDCLFLFHYSIFQPSCHDIIYNPYQTSDITFLFKAKKKNGCRGKKVRSTNKQLD